MVNRAWTYLPAEPAAIAIDRPYYERIAEERDGRALVHSHVLPIRSGDWTIELTVEGPEGTGAGVLSGIPVGARPGPPLAPMWLIGALPLFFLIGLGVRWISIPLMFTMLVAIFAVHWQHGWQAIADTKFCLFNCWDAQEAALRLDKAKEILQEHGNYSWLTEQGSFVVLNNGIEFGVTYFVMLLALFFIGAGKYLSLDDWIARKFKA